MITGSKNAPLRLCDGVWRVEIYGNEYTASKIISEKDVPRAFVLAGFGIRAIAVSLAFVLLSPLMAVGLIAEKIVKQVRQNPPIKAAPVLAPGQIVSLAGYGDIVREAEREACAKVAESFSDHYRCKQIASAIRERK